MNTIKFSPERPEVVALVVLLRRLPDEVVLYSGHEGVVRTAQELDAELLEEEADGEGGAAGPAVGGRGKLVSGHLLGSLVPGTKEKSRRCSFQVRT